MLNKLVDIISAMIVVFIGFVIGYPYGIILIAVALWIRVIIAIIEDKKRKQQSQS